MNYLTQSISTMNLRRPWLPIAIALLIASPSFAEVRKWSDESGRFSVEAELLTSDKDFVVLEREKDGELIAVRKKELSAKDQAYISENAEERDNDEADVETDRDLASRNPKKYDSTWKMRDGEVVKGRLIGFGRQDLVIKRERGKIFINDRELEELPPAYGKIVPDVVSRVDNAEIETSEELEEHLAENGAGPFTYSVEGIQLDLATGGGITVPVSLLAVSEAKQVQPALERWQAANEDDVSESERMEASSRERLVLDSQERYRRRDQPRQSQLKMMELNLLAVQAGDNRCVGSCTIPNATFRVSKNRRRLCSE